MTRREAIGGAFLSGAQAIAMGAMARAGERSTWPLWESYAKRFIDAEGRVVDHDDHGVTTSEGQSYAAFFALVAGDRARFDRILSWTDRNLAAGELGERLPAWRWGRDEAGRSRVLDPNSASDSDLWLSYAMIEAGRIWNDADLADRGHRLAATCALHEVRRMGGLGSMLLPGPEGFVPQPGVFQLNPSYLPLQLILRLADTVPNSPWGRVAQQTPTVLEGAARSGFVLDWVAYWETEGFRDAPLPRPHAKASYDAIRVYLWAGMLHPKTKGRERVLAAMPGMAKHLKTNEIPPAEVLADGRVADPNGGVGFSAALVPYLSSLGRERELATQLQRLRGCFNPSLGLYDESPKYYDQNLILFGLGWSEGRFSFGPRGTLHLEG